MDTFQILTFRLKSIYYGNKKILEMLKRLHGGKSERELILQSYVKKNGVYERIFRVGRLLIRRRFRKKKRRHAETQ